MSAPASRSGAALASILTKLFLAGLVGVLAMGVVGYMTFFSTSHHETSSGMYSMYGDLTPSAATDITLRPRFLDHTAEYTVSEEGLNRFLTAEFGTDFEGPKAVDRETFEEYYRNGQGFADGRQTDWEWNENLVSYDMWKSRGTSHSLLRDTETGRTHQASAHW